MKYNIELHAHPNFKAYSMDSIIQSMTANRLDITALSYLDGLAYSDISESSREMESLGYDVAIEDSGIEVKKDDMKFYILKSIEVTTKDGFHVLGIGTEDIGLNTDVESVINHFDNDGLVLMPHLFADIYNLRKDVSYKKTCEIQNLCDKYKGRIAVEYNGCCNPIIRRIFGGGDVNKKVLDLSGTFQNHSLPIYAATDLDAKTKNSLRNIGTARISADLDFSSIADLVQSIKASVLSDNHRNHFGTIEGSAFATDIIFPYIYEKIRST